MTHQIEKQQYGVEVTSPEGKAHVDTQFNGGFSTPESALDAAEDGYRREYKTVAVQRTVTTIYGPWTPITEGETDGNRQA